MRGALLEAAEFAAITDGTAHLMRQFGRHAVGLLADDFARLAHQCDAFGHRARDPVGLGSFGALSSIKSGVAGEHVACEVHRSVNR